MHLYLIGLNCPLLLCYTHCQYRLSFSKLSYIYSITWNINILYAFSHCVIHATYIVNINLSIQCPSYICMLDVFWISSRHFASLIHVKHVIIPVFAIHLYISHRLSSSTRHSCSMRCWNCPGFTYLCSVLSVIFVSLFYLICYMYLSLGLCRWPQSIQRANSHFQLPRLLFC